MKGLRAELISSESRFSALKLYHVLVTVSYFSQYDPSHLG